MLSNQLTLNYGAEWGTGLMKRFEVTTDYLHSKGSNDYDAWLYDKEKDDPGRTAFGYRNNSDLWKTTALIHLPFCQAFALRSSATANFVQTRYVPEWTLEAERPAIGTQVDHSRTRVFSPIVAVALVGSWKVLYYTAGGNLRANDTRYLSDAERYHDTQWGFNPRASLRYLFNEEQQSSIELSYVRLIDDVPYDAISSKQKWVDANHYTIGNPELKSSLEHNLRFNLLFFKQKLDFTAEFFKNARTWSYNTFESETEPGVFYTKPMNTEDYYGCNLQLGTRLKISDWWWMRADAYCNMTQEKGEVSGQMYSGFNCHYYFSTAQYLSFMRHRWFVSIDAYYEPTFDTYDRTFKRVGQVMVNITKQFKCGIALTADVNYLYPRTIVTHLPSHDLISKSDDHGWSFKFGISWNFKGGRKNIEVKQTESIQENTSTTATRSRRLRSGRHPAYRPRRGSTAARA